MTENSVVTVNTAGSNTTEIVLFNNPNFGQIRTMMIDEEPWFVGRMWLTSSGTKTVVEILTVM